MDTYFEQYDDMGEIMTLLCFWTKKYYKELVYDSNGLKISTIISKYIF